jgi:transposase
MGRHPSSLCLRGEATKSLQSLSLEMVVSLPERRVIWRMHLQGRSVNDIALVMGPATTSRTIYRVIKRAKHGLPLAASVSSGRRRSVRTSKVVEAVRSRLRRKARRNLTKMAKEMKISRRSLGRIIHTNLHMRSYKTPQREALTTLQMENRMKKSLRLLSLVGPHHSRNLLFTDEKIFTLQETGNHPQVKFHCRQGERHANYSKCHRSSVLHSPGVMVWGGVSKLGKTPLIFVDPGTKINATYYQDVILEEVKTWCLETLRSTTQIVLQQDWAPAHRARSTKAWLRDNNIPFLDEDVYPAASPDLNPMDFCIWGCMQQELRETNLSSLDELKQKLQEIWDSLDQAVIDLAIGQLPKRIRQLRTVKGARFE